MQRVEDLAEEIDAVDAIDTIDAHTAFVAAPADRPIYQAGAFLPMPVVVAVSHDTDGQINVAPYSLCFPQPEAGARMLLLVVLRDANTWRNLLATGRVTLCFLPDDPRLLAHCLALAKAEPSATKSAGCGLTIGHHDGRAVIAEAEQVFCCTLRGHTFSGDGCERRALLHVDEVWLRPRWARALRRGFGAPKLAVEYGFRGRGAGWVSQPQLVFGGPALRPRFTLEVRLDPAEVVAALGRALAHEGSGVEGYARERHVQVNIPRSRARPWSPELQIEVEPIEGGARLSGKIGPHSRVWTMFVAGHAAVGISAGFALLFAFSQWTLGQPPTALWAVLGALALHAFVAGAAFIGQGLGADDTFRLRAFVQDALTY